MQAFFAAQWILIAAVVGLFVYFLSRTNPRSGFKNYESEPDTEEMEIAPPRPKIGHKSGQSPRQVTPDFNGLPHEILGIAANSNEKEIQKAYRVMMKKYHPDKRARPGTAAWNEAQKIAAKINQAKETLLKFRKR